MSRVLLVTDRRQAEATGRALVDVVGAALDGAAVGVLLREKDLPLDERAGLAVALRRVTAAAGARLTVAGDVDLALACGADGVHLAADDPWPDVELQEALDASRPSGRMRVSRSCHTPDELAAADRRHADWATYSPVFATASKPGYGPALGVDGLAAACAGVARPPVVALGGIDAGTARRCTRVGAAGVAVTGALMRADDPAATAAALDREAAAGYDEWRAAALSLHGGSDR